LPRVKIKDEPRDEDAYVEPQYRDQEYDVIVVGKAELSILTVNTH
jgi:hypothetical protein